MFWERSDSTLTDDQIRLLKEITIDSEVVRGAMQKTLIPVPGFSRPGVLHSGIDQLPVRGTFNRVFRVRGETAVHSGWDFGYGYDRVARFNIHPSVSTQSLHLESWAANEALARGFPTPRIVHVDTSRIHAPYPFQVIEYVDGLALRSAPEETVRKVLSQLGTALARLHAGALPSDRYGRIGLGTLPEWDLFWSYGAQEHIDYCGANGLIGDNHEEWYDMRGWMCESIDLAAPALLHGDLSYDNIILDRETNDLKSVIDWEDAVLGDPIFELAGLATFHPIERHASFLDAYYGGPQRPDQFEYRFWVYYLRIALAKAVHRHRFGYPDEPVYRNNPDIAYQAANTRISLALSKLKGLI